MQVRLVRMATQKWRLPVGEVAGIFDRCQVFAYIRECFGLFHVEGDEAVWEELIPYLKSKGCQYA